MGGKEEWKGTFVTGLVSRRLAKQKGGWLKRAPWRPAVQQSTHELAKKRFCADGAEGVTVLGGGRK